MADKKKIYLSPERRPAPHGPFADGVTFEHDYCVEIAEMERKDLERCGFEVIVAPDSMTIAQRAKEANRLKMDLYQAIHTNAGGGTGTEMFYYPDPESIRANQLVYDELVELYPSKRGIKNGKAYLENNSTDMVSVYAEIAFHDTKKDVEFLLSEKRQIAAALARGTCKYFGVAYLEEEAGGQAEEIARLKERLEALKKEQREIADELIRLAERLKA